MERRRHAIHYSIYARACVSFRSRRAETPQGLISFPSKTLEGCMILTSIVLYSDRIPNLPFFYLLYRAWSHWKAISGGKHLQFLLQQNLLSITPSPILDRIYSRNLPVLLPSKPNQDDTPTKTSNTNCAHNQEPEILLLTTQGAKQLAADLAVPEIEPELERAIWQVNEALKANESKSQQPGVQEDGGKAPEHDKIDTSKTEDKKNQ
jgi:hypothetical protein